MRTTRPNIQAKVVEDLAYDTNLLPDLAGEKLAKQVLRFIIKQEAEEGHFTRTYVAHVSVNTGGVPGAHVTPTIQSWEDWLAQQPALEEEEPAETVIPPWERLEEIGDESFGLLMAETKLMDTPGENVGSEYH